MLILASASPRRRELLEVITTEFTVLASDSDETTAPGTPPTKAVEELALRKALSVAEQHPDDLVIGADTIVVLDGAMLGKPQDEDDARRMLRALSGREHTVYTGVAVLRGERRSVFHEGTGVFFAPMSEAMIDAYVATGDPMDKAGAYGIQGRGALFIERIHGDYYNVMGLPVCRLGRVLGEFAGS